MLLFAQTFARIFRIFLAFLLSGVCEEFEERSPGPPEGRLGLEGFDRCERDVGTFGKQQSLLLTSQWKSAY